MTKIILITGGAGFIGSHVTDALLARGYRVRLLDNLEPQVHGPGGMRPDYLDSAAELIVGDVRDAAMVAQALRGVSAVFHFAASVGVGQSMYEIEKYTSVNNLGTAVLLEALAHRPVERLIVASSMSIYGEGRYRDADGRLRVINERPLERLKAGQWEPMDEQGRTLEPIATDEAKPPALASVYALSKFDQERLCLMFGRAYRIPAVALRFFNVYGTRQALSNPYTGVLAIFAARYLNGAPPLVYEDGAQRRDFVSVHDVARACVLALESPAAPGQAINIGSGRSWTVCEAARLLATALGKEVIQPEITGKYRMGDIRHCFADIERARALLGFEPRFTLETGLGELTEWLRRQIAHDRAVQAAAELSQRGLTV